MRPSLTGEETGTESGATTEEPSDETGDPGLDCPLGSAGCSCTAGGACDPQLVCSGGFCMPEGCTPGMLNCSCDQGSCTPGLECKSNASGDVCVEPVDGADSGDDTTGEPSCEPQGDGDDCNGNGVRDTCDPKQGEGTCTLWGYTGDADDIPANQTNGDIRLGFAESRERELVLGLGFHDPLDFSDPDGVFELWWFFDVDSNAATGSEQVYMFGGDTYVRVDIDTNRSATVRVGDGNNIGSEAPVPGADVDVEDDGRLVVVSLEMPDELMDLVDNPWVGVSGWRDGGPQPPTDKTPIATYRVVPPVDEDCDGDGLFDACQDTVDQIGWGPGVGDGIPDSCQSDDDGDGIDDACQ